MEKPIAYVERDLEEIVPDFFEDSREEIRNLNDALASKDYKALKDLGHKIKGSSVSYGFKGMSDLGLTIEKAAVAEKSFEEIGKLVEEFTFYVENVEVVYVDED